MANIVEYILRLKDELSGPLEDAGDAAKAAKVSFTELNQGVELLEKGWDKAAAVVDKTIQRLADYKNGVVDTSTRTGVAVETLQGLQLAFEGSGQSAGAMEAVLAPLNKRLIDTARGTGEAQRGFADLGISVVDSAGNLRSADDVLRETLTALQDIEDPTLRAAQAASILGEGGAKALQALGDTDLDAFIQQAQTLGPAFRDGGAGAAEFQRAMSDLELASLGALDRIAEAFGGESGVTGAIDAVTDGVVFLSTLASGVLGSIVSDTKASVDAIVGAVEALQRGDLSAAGAAISGFSLNPLAPVDFDTALSAAEAATNARAQVRRGRAATRTAGAGGGGRGSLPSGTPGVGATAAVAEAAGVDQALISGLLQDLATDEANAVLEREARIAEEAIAAAEGREAKLDRITDGVVTSLGLLGRGFQIAASSFGAVVTGDVAGAAGGLLTGGAGLVASGLDLAAPAIGAAAGAAIGSVALPGIGTVGGAAVGAAVTKLVPFIGDAIEGVAGSIAQGIQQILELGQLGAGGVAQRLDDFQRDFLKGLEVLPEVVRDVLPDFAAEFGPALAEAAPIFAIEFTKALISSAPELWASFIDAQQAYVRSSVTENVGFAGDILGGARDNAQGLLQSASQAIGPGVAGSTVINVSGVIAENVDRFVDEVSSRLGTRGLNLQLGAR